MAVTVKLFTCPGMKGRVMSEGYGAASNGALPVFGNEIEPVLQ